MKDSITQNTPDTPAVEVRDLSVEYHSGGNIVKAVNHVSFTLPYGRSLGLVGETGAGKTSTALALMRLLPDRVSHVPNGEIYLKGDNIMNVPESHMKLMRGEIISMIFQDPMTALNPIMTVGNQIREALKIHDTRNLSKAEIEKRVEEVLELVGIPAQRKGDYPLQFSGGMKQRVVIAIALACSPDILIADEPTTALDVTIQAQVLALIDELRQKMGTSMIMISHDLGVVVRTCDDVAIMYAGEIIEYGSVEQIYSPGQHHPYTAGLFGAIPNIRSKSKRLTPIDGLMPDPTHLPEGCKFSPRCPHCTEKCRQQEPPVFERDGHRIKCHLFGGEEA
jgi:peptide/nickel transport system ATP-binding protein